MCKDFNNFFFLVVFAYMVSYVRYSQLLQTFINTNTFTLVIYTRYFNSYQLVCLIQRYANF